MKVRSESEVAQPCPTLSHPMDCSLPGSSVIMETACGMRKELQIFGNDYDTRDGTCIRDYVHVTDLACAHVKALEYIKKNDTSLSVNLGSETGITVTEMVDAARKITGKEIPAKYVERRPGDPACLYATSQYARDTLQWVPQFSDLNTLIETTWKAYLANNKGAN